MLNQAIIVGRLKSINDNVIEIASQRPFKDDAGEYKVDIIPVILVGPIWENLLTYCKVEDVVGIKGRLENKSGLRLVAEKITFLSKKKDKDE